MFWHQNIQGRPTPELYERLRSGELVFNNETGQTFQLVSVELRDVTQNVPVSAEVAEQIFSLLSVELRNVIQNLGTFPTGEVTSNFSLQGVELRTVLIDLGTVVTGEVTSNFSLQGVELKVVLKDVGTYMAEVSQTFGLMGVTLV